VIVARLAILAITFAGYAAMLTKGMWRAGKQAARPVWLERSIRKLNSERKREVLCAWRHRESGPKPDRDPAVPHETARCAQSQRIRGRPRRAGWKFSPRAAQGSPGPSVRPRTAHSLPMHSQPGQARLPQWFSDGVAKSTSAILGLDRCQRDLDQASLGDQRD